MNSDRIRIAVLGEEDITGLSPGTRDTIYRLESLDIGGIAEIDLILLESSGEEILPCDSVFIYDQICGTDHAARSVRALEHYSSHFTPSLIVVAVEKDAERIVPKAAFNLGTSGFLQCDSIDFDRKVNKFTVVKSVYGGNASAHYSIEKTAVISFNHSRKKKADLKDKRPVLNYMDYSCSCENRIVRKTETEYITEQGIDDSDFVVICGRGLGSKAAVDEVCRWAETVGAVVGGTKKVIDHGWLPVHRLIGQTGHMISPSLCLVIGASGATPFINGITGSKKIIAVNNDSDARIFDYADIAVVEDAGVIMTGLLEEIIEQDS